MPIFKFYSPEGELLKEIVEPLTKENFELFMEQYGEEKARVYLEALGEFTSELDKAIHKINDGKFAAPRAINRVWVNTSDLHDNLVSIIKFAKTHPSNSEEKRLTP